MAMLPDDTGRGQSGAFPRAVSTPRPENTVDPVAVGPAAALRHMTAANTASTLLLDDMAEARALVANDPRALDAFERVEQLARRVRREVAFALQDITAPPGE